MKEKKPRIECFDLYFICKIKMKICGKKLVVLLLVTVHLCASERVSVNWKCSILNVKHFNRLNDTKEITWYRVQTIDNSLSCLEKTLYKLCKSKESSDVSYIEFVIKCGDVEYKNKNQYWIPPVWPPLVTDTWPDVTSPITTQTPQLTETTINLPTNSDIPVITTTTTQSPSKCSTNYPRQNLWLILFIIFLILTLLSISFNIYLFRLSQRLKNQSYNQMP